MRPSPPGSVTALFHQLRLGDEQAAAALWTRFADRMNRLAERNRTQRGAIDAEDIVQEAFAGFCQAARSGRFDQIEDRDGVWRLLVMLTLRRSWSQRERETRQKRGGAAGAKGWLFSRREVALDALPGKATPPDFAIRLADFLQEALARLPEPELRAVALFKLQDLTNEEVGQRVGCDARTVQRRWKAARDLWRNWASAELPD